jgi:hypothetical protein
MSARNRKRKTCREDIAKVRPESRAVERDVSGQAMQPGDVGAKKMSATRAGLADRTALVAEQVTVQSQATRAYCNRHGPEVWEAEKITRRQAPCLRVTHRTPNP